MEMFEATAHSFHIPLVWGTESYAGVYPFDMYWSDQQKKIVVVKNAPNGRIYPLFTSLSYEAGGTYGADSNVFTTYLYHGKKSIWQTSTFLPPVSEIIF